MSTEDAVLGRELGWDVIAFHPFEDPSQEQSDAKREKMIQRNRLRRNFVWRLRKLGFYVAKQKSIDGSDCLIKISAPTSVLEPHAELIGMEMKTNLVDPVTKRNLYREFSRAHKNDFIAHGPRFFTSLERSRLIFSLLEESIAKGGAGLNLDKLINDEKAIRIFPLHDAEAQENLANRWLSWHKFSSVTAYSVEMLKDLVYRFQPLDDIRDYFGEKIAFYFAWLDWYILFLKPLSLLGLLIFLVQVGYALDYSNLATVFYAVVLCIWGTLFAETWKRREATLAFNWDVQDFEEEERVRPEFLGPKKPGVYAANGNWVDLGYKFDQLKSEKEKASVPQNVFFSPWQRFKRILLSLNVLAVFLFVLVIGTFAVLAFRVFVQADSRAGPIWGGIVAGILNAVFILVMNQIYNRCAHMMNDWENHRTDTQYEDRLIAKQFCFKFVNSFSSLAFIAFAKDDPEPSWLTDVPLDQRPAIYGKTRKIMGMDIGRCKGQSCMSELFTQLMTLQLTMIFVSNFMEIGLPFLMKKIKVMRELKAARGRPKSRSIVAEDGANGGGLAMPKFELEMHANVYGGVLEEYTELFIQFGHITLFASAFPLSSMCALLNNIIEVKVDGFKLLLANQRPRYLGAEDIGTWQIVLEFMSYVSVISNCAIICFTSEVFKGKVVDRDSSDYMTCVSKCNSDYNVALGFMGNYTTVTDWVGVANTQIAVGDFSACLDKCACDSPIDTCYPLSWRIWIFVVSEHILLGAKLLLAWMIPDKPSFVEEAEAREEVEKHLEHWDPNEEETVDESVLREWDNGEDNNDSWDNEPAN
eukprot:c1945_g1_i1.p1 GENE.c1945_g1_i1~~c1945_g1_i1.p1  ORF type:complete len:810 (+),score=205.98 c1945_g1_i1:46-2475(+)